MFEKYQRIAHAEIRPVTKEDIEEFKTKGSISTEGSIYDVFIAATDLANGSPCEGDMIARNPANHDGQWLIAKDYFMDNFDKIKPIGETSDGYHTFDELYDFRMVYNALAFNTMVQELGGNSKGDLYNIYGIHKSKCHYDGEPCFDGKYFIVIATLPTGQISNHYPLNYWDMFKIPEEPKALFPFDNHTSKDVLERIKSFLLSNGI